MLVENLIHTHNNLAIDSNSVNVSCDKDKLYRTILPTALVVMKRIVYSKQYLSVFNGVYILLSLFALYVMVITSISDYEDYGVAYAIYYLLQSLIYIVTPYFGVNSFLNSLENDFICHVLTDAYRFDPKLSMKFAAFTHLNLLLIVCSVAIFVASAHLSILLKISAGVSSLFYITPFVLVYSWFVCVVYAHWIRLESFLDLLRRARDCSDVRYHAETYPFLSSRQKQQQLLEKQQEEQPHEEDEEACQRSDSKEFPGTLSPSDSIISTMTAETLGTRYYEELTICLALSKCCGKSLLFFTISSLFLVVGAVWALYLRIHGVGGLVAYMIFAMIQTFELGFFLSSCNESGNLICREICSYLLSESCQHRRESNSYQEATFLLGCIDHAKLEIAYFGNFSLRSRTLLAIFGSIVGALIPGIILSSSNQ